MAKIEITPQIVEFLALHYSNNSNKALAANLSIIVNADSKNGKEKKTITLRDVRLYARQLGLKKSQEFVFQATRRKVNREKNKVPYADLSSFSGSFMSDVELTVDDNIHVIVSDNIKASLLFW